MMTSKTDIQHLYIDAKVYNDRVEELYYINDPARNIRRRPQTKVWRTDRILGYGSFGEVRLERNQEDGKERAVKKIKIKSEALKDSEYEKELKALLEFSKPKYRDAGLFVDFFGWFQDESDVFLAMEYVPLGDLESNVGQAKKIAEIEARSIIEQLLSGLEIMHAESFAHRDLKPQNVLVVYGPPEWWVKLADFGLSKRSSVSTAFHSRIGTETYMAPEILDSSNADGSMPEYSNAVDLWAVGCIAYRLVTGMVPFPSGRSLWRYCDDRSSFPVETLSDNEITGVGSNFIRELLRIHPKERLSASQALHHPWITTEVLDSHPSPRRRSKDVPSAPQRISAISEPTLSCIDYNTASHGALQSNPCVVADQGVNETSPLHTSEHGENYDRGKNEFIRPQPALNKMRRQLGGKPVGVASSNTINHVDVRAWPEDFLSDEWDDVWPRSMPFAFSPNGQLVALAPTTDLIRVWNILTRVRRCSFYCSNIMTVNFSPNGELIASISSYKEFNPSCTPTRSIRIWSISSQTIVYKLENINFNIKGVEFSSNSQIIAFIDSCLDAVHIYNLVNKTTNVISSNRNLNINKVRFSPGGQLVTFGTENKTVRLWDPVTGALYSAFEGSGNGVRTVAFLPHGDQMMIAFSDNSIELRELVTKSVLYTFASGSNYIDAIAISPSGQFMAIASSSGHIEIWDLVMKTVRYRFPARTSVPQPMAFSPNGQLMTLAANNSALRIWDFNEATMHRFDIEGDLNIDMKVPISSRNYVTRY